MTTSELVKWRGASVPVLSPPEVSRATIQDYLNWIQYSQNYMGAPTPVTTYGNRPAEPISSSFEGFVWGMLYADGPVAAVEAYRLRVFGQAPLLYQEMTDGRPGDFFDDERLDRLRTPWPGGNLGDLMKRALVYGDFGGNAFILDLEDELVLVRPDWVEIVLAKRMHRGGQVGWRQVGIVYYEGGLGIGDGVPFLPGEYAHFVPGLPDPLATYRGMSWLTPLVREVQADKSAGDHKVAFFENAASPNLAVSLPKEITPTQFKEFVDKMDSEHRGATQAYKTLYTAGGADVTVIGANMQQMDFSAVQGKGETRIANAGGVSPALLSFSEGMQGSSLNAGNFVPSKRNFVDTTMRDLWTNWAGSLQKMDAFLAPQDRVSRLSYDPRDIPFLRDDEQDIAQRQQTQASTLASLITAGYKPPSAQQFLVTDDPMTLEHSGLTSVQLMPPGSQDANGDGTPDAEAAASDEYQQALDEFRSVLEPFWDEIFRRTIHIDDRDTVEPGQFDEDEIERKYYDVRVEGGHVGGGRFRKIGDIAAELLNDWLDGKGDTEDPLDHFTQPQLKKIAEHHGIKTPPRAGKAALKLAILNDAKARHRDVHEGPKPRASFTLHGPDHRDLDVGVYVERKPDSKIFLRREKDGRPGTILQSFDDLDALHSWAQEHGETELAGWAAKERDGSKPAAKAKKATSGLGVDARERVTPDAGLDKAYRELRSSMLHEKDHDFSDLTDGEVKELRGHIQADPRRDRLYDKSIAAIDAELKSRGVPAAKRAPAKKAAPGADAPYKDASPSERAHRDELLALRKQLAVEHHERLSGPTPEVPSKAETDLNRQIADVEARGPVAVPAKKATKRAPRKAAIPPAEQAARDRQAKIDRADAVHSAVSEVEQLLGDGASDRALKARITSRTAGQPDLRARLLAAVGDEPAMRKVLADLRREEGLTPIGAPGDVVPFDPQLHHSIGGDIPRGTPVTVVRPGHQFDRQGLGPDFNGNEDVTFPADVQAGVAEPSAAPTSVPTRDAEIEDRIRASFRAHGKPGGWVALADIRDDLGEQYNRHEVDAVLKRLEQSPDVNIVPESNQKALTQRDRDAAVVIGDQAKQFITFGDPSPTSVPEVPGQAPKKAARDLAEGDMVPSLDAADDEPRVVTSVSKAAGGDVIVHYKDPRNKAWNNTGAIRLPGDMEVDLAADPSPRPVPEVPARPSAPRGNQVLDAAPVSLLSNLERPSGASPPTATERAAFDAYGNDGQAINARLRSGGRITPPIAAMDAAMARSPLSTDVEVWRGVPGGADLPGLDLSGDVTGAEFTDRSFVSTSVSQSVAEQFAQLPGSGPKVVLRVTAPRGTKAVAFSGGDGITESQGELLLERGLTFRVTADHGSADGFRRLDVEIVPSAPSSPTKATPAKAASTFERGARARRVVGRDRTAEVAQSAPQIFNNEGQLDRTRRQKAGDLNGTELQAIGRMQGFDAPPTVATEQQVDAAVANGWVEMWRGSSTAGGLPPAAVAERFRTGDYAPGFGEYGNGYYATASRDNALVYTAPTQFPPFATDESGLQRMALSPDARVLEVDDPATALREAQAAAGLDSSDRSPSGRLLSDLGHLAAAQGYDALVVHGQPDGAGGEPVDQYVILNRSAVMVQAGTPEQTIAALESATDRDEARRILGNASQADLDALAKAYNGMLWVPASDRTLADRRAATINSIVGRKMDSEATRYQDREGGYNPEKILQAAGRAELVAMLDDPGQLRRLGLTRQRVQRRIDEGDALPRGEGGILPAMSLENLSAPGKVAKATPARDLEPVDTVKATLTASSTTDGEARIVADGSGGYKLQRRGSGDSRWVDTGATGASVQSIMSRSPGAAWRRTTAAKATPAKTARPAKKAAPKTATSDTATALVDAGDDTSAIAAILAPLNSSQLKDLARTYKITGASKMRRDELVSALSDRVRRGNLTSGVGETIAESAQAAQDLGNLRAMTADARRASLDPRSLSQLQDLLRLLGLPTSGSKEELLDRLLGGLESGVARASVLYDEPEDPMGDEGDDADSDEDDADLTDDEEPYLVEIEEWAAQHLDEDFAEASRAAGHDTTLGHDELHHYWVAGPGLAKWAGSPKPWTTLVAHLTKYVGPLKAKVFASRWFIEHFGYAAGSDKNRVAHGRPPRGHRVGPG